mmetsp:Transcript_70005/g.196174  ORF Transcript_70005/g.196174 Transcript_70005/m.196174 type:complete len:232 (+) Transcript_70005:220-915(+)
MQPWAALPEMHAPPESQTLQQQQHRHELGARQRTNRFASPQRQPCDPAWRGAQPAPTDRCDPGRSQALRRQMDSPLGGVGNRRRSEYRHAHVPKTVNLQEEYNKSQDVEAPPTTLMIRNIPNHFTQKQLIGELENLGFAGSFDFLYIPLDKGTMSNVGYAFVNFVAPEWAAKCTEAFKDYRFKRHRKVAATSVAHLQGFEANLAHYQNSAVSSAKLKQRRPVVIANISAMT